MLKIIRSSDLALKKLRANDNKVVGGGDKANNKNLSESKKSKNAKSGILTYINTGAIGKPIFLTSSTKETFNQLK